MKTGFLQASTGENSSRRLAFLSGHAAATLIVFYNTHQLMQAEEYSLVIDICKYYLFYCLILGGFVASEFITRFFNLLKKR